MVQRWRLLLLLPCDCDCDCLETASKSDEPNGAATAVGSDLLLPLLLPMPLPSAGWRNTLGAALILVHLVFVLVVMMASTDISVYRQIARGLGRRISALLEICFCEDTIGTPKVKIACPAQRFFTGVA